MPPMKHCEGIADKLSSPPGYGATCSAVTKYDLGGRLGVIRGDRIELLWARTNPNGGTWSPGAAVRFVLSFGQNAIVIPLRTMPKLFFGPPTTFQLKSFIKPMAGVKRTSNPPPNWPTALVSLP